MARVLQVVPYFAPAWSFGGPPKVMWEEARALAKLGHDVAVLTTDAFGNHERVVTPSPSLECGVCVHRFRNVSNQLAFHKYRFTPRGFFKAIRHEPADILHLSEVRHELAIGAWRAARRRGIPLLVSAHGTLPRRTGPKAALRAVYDAKFVTPMLRGAAGLLAQTGHERDAYLEFGVEPHRIHLLPLGTESPPATSGSIPFDVPGEAKVILFLGRIHRLKGVRRLLRSFAAIAPEHDDAYLVIAGRDDGDLAPCIALAEELGVTSRVRFPGPIYGDARYDAYRRADLFAITPIHFEETSLASLEAAAVGTPLFLSDEAEAPFLERYDAGFRVPAGEDPADYLRIALATDLAAAGRRAKTMIDERHQWGVVGQLLSELVDQLSG